MRNLLSRLVLAGVVAGSLTATACVGSARGYGRVGVAAVDTAPPAPVKVYYDERPGYVHVQGRWIWDGNQWRWIEGRWMRQRPGHVYTQGYWAQQDGAYVWIDGGWEPRRAGYVYSNGYWDQRGDNYVWVRGRWEPERAGQVWIDGRWVVRDGRRVYRPGHWRERERVRVRDQRGSINRRR